MDDTPPFSKIVKFLILKESLDFLLTLEQR